MMGTALENMLAYRLPYGKFLHTEWETLELMKQSGIDLVCVSPMNTVNALGEPYSDYPLIWKWDHAYDFSVLDRQLEEVLSHHPAARFLVTVDLNSPLWLARRLSLDSFYRLTDCVLHPEWKTLTTEYLENFLDHCEQRWGARIEGYIIACGRTLEWIETGNFEPSVRKNIDFRRWCAEHALPRYRVPVIDPRERRRHESVYDPEREGACVAWLRYINALTADLVIHFISTARRHIRREAKIGIFYSHIRSSGIGGHLDCERVLDTAPPDFVIGAACNRPPDIGGNSGFIGVTEMLRRRNINYLFECDRITSDANLKLSESVTLSGGIWSGWKNESEDAAGLKRELGMALVNRLSFWFFNIWGGMYRSPGARNLIRRAADVWRRYAPLSTGSAAQILIVIDPESNYRLHSRREVSRFTRVETNLSAAGLPADTATMSDLESMDLSRYRMILFQNLVAMDDGRAKMLKRKVFKDGRSVIFLNTPGIIWNGRYAESNPQRLIGPGTPASGIIVRKRSSWTMILAANAELLTAEKLYELAVNSGVHIYCRNAAFHASRELLSIHRREGGRVEISLPFRARRVMEIFEDRLVATDAERFVDDFPTPGTHVYHLEPDERDR